MIYQLGGALNHHILNLCIVYFPRGPKIEKLILARAHEKIHTPTHARTIIAWKFHSRFEMFILPRKFQSQALLFCGQRGARNEKAILDWKFHSVLKAWFFSILPLEMEFFQSCGPLGYWRRVTEPKKLKKRICAKSGVSADSRKSAKKCTKPYFLRKKLRKKMWYCALSGALSGLGGNPTFGTHWFLGGFLGCVARIQTQNLKPGMAFFGARCNLDSGVSLWNCLRKSTANWLVECDFHCEIPFWDVPLEDLRTTSFSFGNAIRGSQKASPRNAGKLQEICVKSVCLNCETKTSPFEPILADFWPTLADFAQFLADF